MRWAPQWICALVVLPFAAATATAHGYRVGAIEISHPRLIVMPGGDSACIGAILINHGHHAEVLIGASVAMAQGVHLIAAASTAAPPESPAPLEIAPGVSVDLAGRGWCLALGGIADKLSADMVLPGHLQLSAAGQVVIDFVVEVPGP